MLCSPPVRPNPLVNRTPKKLRFFGSLRAARSGAGYFKLHGLPLSTWTPPITQSIWTLIRCKTAALHTRLNGPGWNSVRASDLILQNGHR